MKGWLASTNTEQFSHSLIKSLPRFWSFVIFVFHLSHSPMDTKTWMIQAALNPQETTQTEMTP